MDHWWVAPPAPHTSLPSDEGDFYTFNQIEVLEVRRNDWLAALDS
jgi:hypothetical protein